MRYANCEYVDGTPRQNSKTWLYVIDGTPKVGATVAVPFGIQDETVYMKVIAVATRRDKIENAWTGPLKTGRLATTRERKAQLVADKAVAAYDRAEQRMLRAFDALTEAQAASS